jgi:hypothetical protein
MIFTLDGLNNADKPKELSFRSSVSTEFRLQVQNPQMSYIE